MRNGTWLLPQLSEKKNTRRQANKINASQNSSQKFQPPFAGQPHASPQRFISGEMILPGASGWYKKDSNCVYNLKREKKIRFFLKKPVGVGYS
jgi:hypothetical protein